MAVDAATGFAVAASLLVAALAGYMAYRVLRSYRMTSDLRLLFVVMAFLVFVLKSIFIAITVTPPHVVRHDTIEAVGALLDVIVVALLFIPFVAHPHD